jgi:hypothetical protein
MKNLKTVNLNIFLISAVVISFEILSTRISSVVYVQNYAFIILSLAILGLGSGGVFAYYKVKNDNNAEDLLTKIIFRFLILMGVSILIFILSVTLFKLIIPFIYFFLLLLPFFFAGIVYAKLFEYYADKCFKLYASDLSGAALGSVIPLIIFNVFNAPNAVLFLALVLFGYAFSLTKKILNKRTILGIYTILVLCTGLLFIFGKNDFLGRVPIGNYPEKDFYYVYEGMNVESKIIESRWSVNGRADLVEYNFQSIVRYLFVDGSAGSQMFRFNGNITNHDKLLNKLLLEFTTSIPFLFLKENEKNNMLVIGPGGGKEILTGLLGGVKNITGVEVNGDFVNIVKQFRSYNGGIYTDFPNVNIVIEEGRHYVKRSTEKWDVLLMALPSTEQIQSIDNFASNENYLLTVEAIKDYLKILSNQGSIIFTVHNRWELVRLLVTAFYAFEEIGINNHDALNHFIVLGDEYAPTIVIRKNSYTTEEINYIKNVISHFPKEIPRITYLPYNWQNVDNSFENRLLKSINANELILPKFIKLNTSDISPVRDDSPYFYKVNRGAPTEYLILLLLVVGISLIVILYPYFKLNINSKNKSEKQSILFSLAGFTLIGIAFMILEISLFQKLVLVLGSPTISLSVLLASMLIGMGSGSYFGSKLYSNNNIQRMRLVLLLLIIVGILIYAYSPSILYTLLHLNKFIRSLFCFLFIFPLAFLAGILFPSLIQLLNNGKMNKYIPWMYGVNGVTSVLGSILAVVLSMIWGFNITMLAGISTYFLLFIFLFNINSKR